MKGKIIFCSDVEKVGANQMDKRTFAIETEGEYPQQIGFDLIKDKVNMVSVHDMGKTCEVSYNIRGREYNGKYYVNLAAWKVKIDQDEDTPF